LLSITRAKKIIEFSVGFKTIPVCKINVNMQI